ncbi:MAG: DNA primase, partial [Proteobacteria bacterium]|nr:DNA primase [Pseudomonadota bacterium]
FSAFAFPRREERAWQPPRRGAAPVAQRDPQQTTRLRRATGSGARDALSAAILAGLLRHPGELARHADALAHSPMRDPRFAVLVDAADSDEPLESAALLTILAERGMAPPAPEEYASLRFGFLSDAAPVEAARADLAQAIALLVERPALDAALAEATARFERDLSEGAYAEQQRLLKRKLAFDARLRQMASARAAASDDAAPIE